jgi:hypothetical protein
MVDHGRRRLLVLDAPVIRRAGAETRVQDALNILNRRLVGLGGPTLLAEAKMLASSPFRPEMFVRETGDHSGKARVQLGLADRTELAR